MTARLPFQLRILLGLVALAICVQKSLCDCDPNKCNVCDDNNLCLECKQGFWLSPLEPGASDGYCLSCGTGCTDCTSDQICLTCQTGYAEYTQDCPLCQKGCASCQYSYDNCTSCDSYYKLEQKHQTCYFKYTVHVLIGGAISICVLVLLIRCLFRWILAPQRAKKYPQSVLDLDSARNTYYVNDVIKIGQTEEREISRVESRGGEYTKIQTSANIVKSFFQDQSTDPGNETSGKNLKLNG